MCLQEYKPFQTPKYFSVSEETGKSCSATPRPFKCFSNTRLTHFYYQFLQTIFNAQSKCSCNGIHWQMVVFETVLMEQISSQTLSKVNKVMKGSIFSTPLNVNSVCINLESPVRLDHRARFYFQDAKLSIISVPAIFTNELCGLGQLIRVWSFVYKFKQNVTSSYFKIADQIRLAYMQY